MWQPIDVQTGKRVVLKKNDWPILIHGTPKAGSSFYTVALTAELIRRGEKIVFLCAHADAIKALTTELVVQQPEVHDTSVSAKTATALEDMQLVTLMRRPNMNLVTSLRALHDWSERVVVIKNIDEVITPELWAVVKTHQKLCLSGDATKMQFEIPIDSFSTMILFSPGPEHWLHQRPALPTYIGDVSQSRRQWQTILREVKVD